MEINKNVINNNQNAKVIIREFNVNNKVINRNSEKFNEYFVNIGRTLTSNIQYIAGDHLALITNRPTDIMFIPTLASNIQDIAGDHLGLIITDRPSDSMFIPTLASNMQYIADEHLALITTIPLIVRSSNLPMNKNSKVLWEIYYQARAPVIVGDLLPSKSPGMMIFCLEL